MYQREPPHANKEVSIQTQLIYNKVLDKKKSAYYTKGRATKPKPFLRSIRVKYKDINNRKKLAHVIRTHYGFGRFNILFWNPLRKNKKYNPEFECLQDSCEHKMSGKCKIYHKHKKGWSCIKNPKINGNWQVRARILIKPRTDQLLNLGGKDYTYTWYLERDQMNKMKFWGEEYEE